MNKKAKQKIDKLKKEIEDKRAEIVEVKENNLSVLAIRLKQERKKLGLSQEMLGKILEVSRMSISNYELDCQAMSLETLKTVCIYFKVSADEMLGLDYER